MNELGFTQTYLESIWNSVTLHMLRQWMYGQTTAIVNEEVTYYFIDIQNFCSYFGILYPAIDNS